MSSTTTVPCGTIGAGLTKDELLECVRINFIRYLESHRSINLDAVAGLTGYTEETIRHYRNGTRVTVPVAMALVVAIPEVGAGLVCPACGSVKGFTWR